jgi:hypothetical protein
VRPEHLGDDGGDRVLPLGGGDVPGHDDAPADRPGLLVHVETELADAAVEGQGIADPRQ